MSISTFSLGQGAARNRSIYATITRRTYGLQARQRAISIALTGGFKPGLQRVSKLLQDTTVDQISEGLRRENASTGKLKAVTASSRNREVTNESFAVGIPSYLNRSRAKYALAIEKGTNKHVGRRISGYWLRQGAPVSFGPRTRTQSFKLTSISVAHRTLANAGQTGPVIGVIDRPIIAHRDYELAWRIVNPRRLILEEVNKVMQRR